MSFQTPFNCDKGFLKTCFPQRGRCHFSYENQSQREKQSFNNADAVLNVLKDLESERAINVWRNISLNSSDHSENKNKCNDMRCSRICSRYKQDLNYMIHLNISHSSWCNFIRCFVSWNIPVLFFLENYYLNKTKPYFYMFCVLCRIYTVL